MGQRLETFGLRPGKRCADHTTDQTLDSRGDERLPPDLVEQPCQPGDAAEHLDRTEVEVVAFALPGLHQLVHLVAFHPEILAGQDSRHRDIVPR